MTLGRRFIKVWGGALLSGAALLWVPATAGAFLGDCSQPITNGAGPKATDCLRILQVGVGSATCVPECICEPKGSAPATATDALLCLQKAVGQAVSLTCPCTVSTTTTSTSTTTSSSTTSTTAGFADSQLIILTKSGSSYAQADLAGAWDLQMLVSGPGAPWWSRGRVTIAANGAASGSLDNSDGTPDPLSVTLILSPSGVITCQGTDCPNSFQAALDSGRSVAGATFTDTDGSSGLIVLTKNIGRYNQIELAGTWDFNALESGPAAPWFGYGPLTIQANGAFSGNISDSDGGVTAASGTLELSGIGALTCSGSACLSQFAGTLDAGKTIGASTGTDTADASSEMDLIVKRAASYSQTDVAGTWRLNDIVSGFQAPFWERGPLTIQADGTVSAGSLVDNTGHTEDITGVVFSLAPDGVITSPTDPGLRCALDADKTVAVCTSTF